MINMSNLVFVQVSYCENDVDCRRLLQLIHFGEMFDPSLCEKTCDNCLKELRWVERDVSDIARQMVNKHVCDSFRIPAHTSLFMNLQSCFIVSLG
jgi:hypothetical protein